MEDLFSLGIIWLAVFAAHWAAGKTQLTPVLWFLAMGCILVNLGVLPEDPGVFIRDLAEIGIIVIMFALGFEENSSAFIRSIRRSWGIALFGAIAPFTVAYATVMYFWGDANAALLCALAMTATAVSLTMVSLRSEGLHKTDAATGIMTSAVLDDIASLALVAILVPMATGDASFSISAMLLIGGKAVAFFVLITVMAVWLFPMQGTIFARIPGLSGFNLSRLITMQNGEHATLTVLLIALWVALLGHEFGFHPAVGAYMAGLILKEEYFLLASHKGNAEKTVHEQTRNIIDSVAFSWIGPVFFIVLGTHLVLDMDILMSVIDETLILFTGLFVGQILSAGLAARYTGGFDWYDSWLIGFGMLGRAELAFVVMDIAYVQHQVITEEMFYTLMATSFCLNVSVPLTIRWWKGRRSDAPAQTENATP
ncbi:putative sodium/hydrogen exchanger [gamma proteobacterium NOR5-3]|nr:putative sodium/hydrogen exchanger [gamma proteobacterium NOR5-3]